MDEDMEFDANAAPQIPPQHFQQIREDGRKMLYVLYSSFCAR
jgi:hypothetical protein